MNSPDPVNVNMQPIRRQRLFEEVERRLEEEIASGRLRAGDEMPSERVLMERFGVGRPAVREALLSLGKKGMVRVGAGERTRVSRPTVDSVVENISSPVRLLLAAPEGMRQLQEARRFFECALVRQVASMPGGQHIDALASRLEANRNALADPAEFERTDVAFHYEIALTTGNPIFSTLHQATIGWLTQQRTVSLLRPGAIKAAFRFHQQIFEAIADHDPDAAEAVMRRHLESVEKYFWKAMATERADAPTGGRT